MIFLNLALAFLLGASLIGTLFSYFLELVWMDITWQFLGGLALAISFALGFSLHMLFESKKKEVASLDREAFETFQKECKMAIRGHLKASILFWVHFYRKEKVKTLEDSKKEIFYDLKREFSDVRWMESMLEDIRQEIARYK